MNFGRGTLRLLLVVFVAWSVLLCAYVATREIRRSNLAHAAECEIQSQTVAQFDLPKCLGNREAATRNRNAALARAEQWFTEGGYLFLLIPPFVITAVLVIVIGACAFVYRGFAATD